MCNISYILFSSNEQFETPSLQIVCMLRRIPYDITEFSSRTGVFGILSSQHVKCIQARHWNISFALILFLPSLQASYATEIRTAITSQHDHNLVLFNILYHIYWRIFKRSEVWHCKLQNTWPCPANPSRQAHETVSGLGCQIGLQCPSFGGQP